MAYIIAVLALTLCVLPGGVANAGALDASNSFLELKLGDIPPLRRPALSAGATLSGGASQIVEATGVFEIDDYAIETAAFTGLPFLTDFRIDLHAEGGNYAAGATYANPMGSGSVSGFGGIAPFSGSTIVTVAGFDIAFDAAPLGVGGTVLANVLQNAITVTGAPFNTGEVKITGITSPVLFVPSLGITGVAFTLNLATAQLMTAIPLTGAESPVVVHTVTLQGSNSLSSTAQTGAIKMISPIRIKTPVESKPGALTKTLRFVPEPEVALQLLSCAGGLLVLARLRSR